jgi:CRP-like cAMP-binding protein
MQKMLSQLTSAGISQNEVLTIKNGPSLQRRRSNCSACNLHDVMACSDVSAEDFDNFHTWVDDLTFQPGETIFRTDEAALNVYCIRSGLVKFVKNTSGGGQRIVRIVQRGGVAGMEAVFTSLFEHTAVAVGEVIACRIPLVNFRRMVEANPTLQRRLLQQSHQALREAETWLSELAGGKQTRERMARLLLLVRDGSSNKIPRFSLKDIGGMLGITVETASRILSEFTRTGLLTKQTAGTAWRHYSADIASLEKIAEQLNGQHASA